MNTKHIILAGLLLTSSLFADVKLTSFDKELMGVEKKMIESSGVFNVENIRILHKKNIDKTWEMYTFEIFMQEKRTQKKFTSPMIIFTDGIHQTNTLMNLKTGVKLELAERENLMKDKRSKKQIEREKFEKKFILDEKYYDEEHLISGKIDAKNKIVIISDPLCVACINTVPVIYNALKDKDDIALFYYHFPLKGLHPTAYTISKAIVRAKKDGIKNVEIKLLKADLMKKFDVYKERDQNLALREFNKIFNTSYTLSDLKNITEVDKDMSIGKDVKLQGTPTIIYNGSLYNSRREIGKLL